MIHHDLLSIWADFVSGVQISQLWNYNMYQSCLDISLGIQKTKKSLSSLTTKGGDDILICNILILPTLILPHTWSVEAYSSVSECLYAIQYTQLKMTKTGGEIHMAQASILSTRACLRADRPVSRCWNVNPFIQLVLRISVNKLEVTGRVSELAQRANCHRLHCLKS